jgi:hypothetical protein
MKKLFLTLTICFIIILATGACGEEFVKPQFFAVKIEGYGPFVLKFDTGADHTLIEKKALIKSGGEWKLKRQYDVYTAASNPLKDVYYFITSNIEIEEIQAGGIYRIFVVEGGYESVPYDGLLGRDILTNFDVTIIKGEVTLIRRTGE